MNNNEMSNEVLEASETIAHLLARVQALEARLNDLCPPPNSSRVTPEGMPPFDVKKRIEALESQKDPYYKNWECLSTERYGEIVIGDSYVKKQYGDAMFDGIYYIVPKMLSLNKVTMVSSNGTALDGGLTILPDLSKIKNASVKEMHICAGFDFIPYLDNFHCLTRLEIVDHPLRPELNRDNFKKQQIRDYCENWNIQLICDFHHYTHLVTNNAHTFVKGQKNLVACVFCTKIYETDVLLFSNRLVCPLCEQSNVLMVVDYSPLREMSDAERMKKLTKWHADGFPDTVSYNCERVNRDIPDTVSYNCERVNRDIKEFQLTDAHVAKANVRSLDPFIGIYHMIPQLTSLEKLTIITNDEKGNLVLNMLPNVSMIRNASLIELRICDECEYIPYLANFPSLKRLEIVSRRGGMSVQPRYKNFAEAHVAFQRIPARKQKIKDYCAENGIELVSTIN
jgi:hypothetical protein